MSRVRLRAEDGRLTRTGRAGVGSAVALIGLAALGVIAGVLIDRLLDFDDTLDPGGEWDEGGGVGTRWDVPL